MTSGVRAILVLGGIAVALVGCSAHDEADDAAESAAGTPVRSSGGRPGKAPPALASFDPDDARKFASLVRAAGLEPAEPVLDPRKIGASDDRGVVLVFPRGKVRREDLRAFRIDTDYGVQGRLRFVSGDRTLYDASVETDELTTVRPLPAQVGEALHAGDRVTWSFAPASGHDAIASFELAEADPSEKIASATRRIDPAAGGLARQMRAQVLLGLGFDQAAYDEASSVARDARSRPAWRIAQAALLSLGIEESRLGDEARSALDDLDRERGGR